MKPIKNDDDLSLEINRIVLFRKDRLIRLINLLTNGEGALNQFDAVALKRKLETGLNGDAHNVAVNAIVFIKKFTDKFPDDLNAKSLFLSMLSDIKKATDAYISNNPEVPDILLTQLDTTKLPSEKMRFLPKEHYIICGVLIAMHPELGKAHKGLLSELPQFMAQRDVY